MERYIKDLGEIQLLTEVIQQYNSVPNGEIGDDCARILLNGHSLLWSIDPCPTPIVKWLGLLTPEIFGWYSVIINVSDIAACGGSPLGMLVSLELPEDTETDFVRKYYNGLSSALKHFNTQLFGGNLKTSSCFKATGTIIGREGRLRISRKIVSNDCDFYLIGNNGLFWSAFAAHYYGLIDTLHERDAYVLTKSLLHPVPQLEAGKTLAELPFDIACMDCSDGPANAIHQLALTNRLDLVLPDEIQWHIPECAKLILEQLQILPDNACFNFGDWQLACVVSHSDSARFRQQVGQQAPITWIGRAHSGTGAVIRGDGSQFSKYSLNENFRDGYNSAASATDIVERYLKHPVFI